MALCSHFETAPLRARRGDVRAYSMVNARVIIGDTKPDLSYRHPHFAEHETGVNHSLPAFSLWRETLTSVPDGKQKYLHYGG